MRTVVLGTVLAVCCGLVADAARAQQVVATSPPSDATDINRSDSRQRTGANHSVLIGHVEIARPDFQIYADQVELFTDQDRAIATGNVVLSQGNSRIAADRGDFNMKTKVGTFYNAWGTATDDSRQKTRSPRRIRPSPECPASPVCPGAPATPTLRRRRTRQRSGDTDVYASLATPSRSWDRGNSRITNGGFTTTACSPRPALEMLTSTTVMLNLDHYTVHA